MIRWNKWNWNYFIKEINQRKSCSKKLNKYVPFLNYIDQALIVLSATSGEVSIILFKSIVGEPVGIASANLENLLSISCHQKKIFFSYVCIKW